MMVFVIGGSASGKSAYAEQVAVLLSKKKKCKTYYLATMQVQDEEDAWKVKHHRVQRSGKGFITMEQPTAVHNALPKMPGGERTVLLECISSLTANEMFSCGTIKSETKVVRNVVRSISALRDGLTNLVVVGSNVFEDGVLYGGTTLSYIRAMGEIHKETASMADTVIEVVVGIPVVLKGEALPCMY